jgi:hypothetical protein
MAKITCSQCGTEQPEDEFRYRATNNYPHKQLCCDTICKTCYCYNNVKKGIIHSLKMNKLTSGYVNGITIPDDIIKLKMLIRMIDLKHRMKWPNIKPITKSDSKCIPEINTKNFQL